jgi:hypothetical protein
LNRRPVCLLVTTTWWPLSARLAARLAQQGFEVSALCPPHHPIAKVTGLRSIHSFKLLDPIDSLVSAIQSTAPDVIIPCDERAVLQLHALHAKSSQWRSLIESSLGESRAFGIVLDRAKLMRTAGELGLPIAETTSIGSTDELRSWFSQHEKGVLKLDGSSGGNGVGFAFSEEHAAPIFERMRRRLGLGTAAKRLFVNHDRAALWEWRERRTPAISIQDFIPGQPANSMLACWKGELLGHVSVEVLRTQDVKGAATVVRVTERDDMALAARLLTRRLGLSGFYGLDFILEQKTGRAVLIELNPRCTQLGHLSLPMSGDLAGVVYRRLAGESTPQSPVYQSGDTIVLFPHALRWDRDCPFLATGWHDVPWDQPALVAELLLAPWPERQWMSRLYNFMSRQPAPRGVQWHESLIDLAVATREQQQTSVE